MVAPPSELIINILAKNFHAVLKKAENFEEKKCTEVHP